MKMELIRNDANRVVGYKLIREATDDIATIEQARDMLFWGMDEDELGYNGRKTENDETIELRFATRAHRREEREKMYNNINS